MTTHGSPTAAPRRGAEEQARLDAALSDLFQRRITFVKLTSSFVLLTDGDHWLLTARPSR